MESAGSKAAFLERNAAESLPAGGLEKKLEEAAAEGRPLRVKLGLDPTAPDIHLGHTVVLQKLREFQDLGNKVVLIVGDYTARVGAPSGRSETRPSLEDSEIEANARSYESQAFRVLDNDSERYELRFNGEWLDMPMSDLFRLARTTTVAQMLDREDFAARKMFSKRPLFTSGQCVAEARVREGSTHHYLVMATACSIRVEVANSNAAFNHPAASRGVGAD